jgi:tetratricopeptide (TPR) repeat protein
MDPPVQPSIIRDFVFIEHRPLEHKKRTAERAEFDLKCLRQDLKENPKDPRLMFYIGRTLYNQGKLLEAGQWFKERVIIEAGSRYERYKSMVYITLIAERTHHSPNEIMELYLGIYKMFPEYKEPLFYAALAAADMGQHDRAIMLLEQSYYSDQRPEFCDKHIVSDREVPKMLCSYYFKTDVSKCVPFLFNHYVSKDLHFDYTYESYLRYIFRIHPLAPCMSKWIVYSDNLSVETFREVIPLQNATVFDGTRDLAYRALVTSYSIENILILNRVDRIPFFPNIANVYLLLTKDVPEGGSLECFPSLRAIITKDDAHSENIKEKYLSPSASRLVITLASFLSLVVQPS